jgi:hypothetical protein
MIQIDSLDTKLRLLQNANDLRAFKLHERRIAKLYSQCQNLDRTRWIAQNPHWDD